MSTITDEKPYYLVCAFRGHAEMHAYSFTEKYPEAIMLSAVPGRDEIDVYTIVGNTEAANRKDALKIGEPRLIQKKIENALALGGITLTVP